jgi:uncharacterized membrane protein YqhA
MKKYFQLSMSIITIAMAVFLNVFMYNEVDPSFGRNALMLYILVTGSLISHLYYSQYKDN